MLHNEDQKCSFLSFVGIIMVLEITSDMRFTSFNFPLTSFLSPFLRQQLFVCKAAARYRPHQGGIQNLAVFCFARKSKTSVN